MAYRNVNCLDPTGVNRPKNGNLIQCPRYLGGPELEGTGRMSTWRSLGMSFQSYIIEVLLFGARNII